MTEFIAALVGGIFTLVGVVFAYAIDSARRHEEESTRARNVLSAVSLELGELSRILQTQVFTFIHRTPQTRHLAARFLLPIGYSTVYRANASFLAEFPVDIAAGIIGTYSLADSVMEELREHNTLTSSKETPAEDLLRLSNVVRGDASSLRTEIGRTQSMIREHLEKEALKPKQGWQGILADFFQPLLQAPPPKDH